MRRELRVTESVYIADSDLKAAVQESLELITLVHLFVVLANF